MIEPRPFWTYTQPSANDWAPELQCAWVELWTGASPPRRSAVRIAEVLFDFYNEIARRARGTPVPPPRTPHQYSYASVDAADLALEMLDHETLVGLTTADRDRLGITPLLGGTA